MTCTPQRPTSVLPLEGNVGDGAGRAAGTVSLTVLPGSSKPARSKSASRRSAVLVLVHVLMAGHVAWWWFKGDVLTPVEPSETAFTLEQGLVNAGFVFFATALLLQLVFGRFMCGWACHVVAVQDLCAWLLKKVGIRPRPFRSRLLMWAPFVLAFYMFLWPTLKREVVWPLAEKHWPAAMDVLGRPYPFPAHGFTSHFVTDDFWATFASVTVGIPFLLVCGGLCVYFLGAKGFCTYGCPYGGFFTPIDRFSPGKILVDHSKCEGCGHCTAVCTSNVRVHEEIKAYGAVVDPGCMKCLDCVSVCPNEALRFGFGAPAVLKSTTRGRKEVPSLLGTATVKKPARARRVFDLTWGEEIGMALVFFATFWSVRGLYEIFPVLFAMGVAGCVTFVAWKAWRTLRGGPGARDVRAMGMQLRRGGRVTGTGWVFVLGTAVLLGLTAHSGVVTYHAVRGDRLYDQAGMDKERLLSPSRAEIPDEKVAAAKRGLEFYKLAGPRERGGIALVQNLLIERNSALLHLIAGDAAAAEACLRRISNARGEQDELSADIARIMDLQGKHEERRAYVDDLLKRHPDFWAVRERRAAEWIAQGRAADVAADAEAALKAIDDGWRTRVARARTHMTIAWALTALNRGEDAFGHLETAAGIAPRHAPARAALAMGYMQIKGDAASAAREMREAVKHEPGSAERRFTLGRLLLETNQDAEAVKEFTLAYKSSGRDVRLRDAVAQILAQAGLAAEAAKWNADHADAAAP